MCTSSQLEQMSPYIRLKNSLMAKEKYIFLVVVTGVVINEDDSSPPSHLTLLLPPPGSTGPSAVSSVKNLLISDSVSEDLESSSILVHSQ